MAPDSATSLFFFFSSFTPLIVGFLGRRAYLGPAISTDDGYQRGASG